MIQPDMTIAPLPGSIARWTGLGQRACVSLIGAGGKTTTMLSMAQSLVLQGVKVLVTTTTKIWPPPGMSLIVAEGGADSSRELALSLRTAGVAAFGDRIGLEGKVHGVHPDRVCWLFADGTADVVLCEADGAAGRSLKAHGPGEPVIPACSTHVVIVAGLDAVGQPADGGSIHHPELFFASNSVQPGAIIQPPHVAAALLAAARFVPSAARTVYLLNKVEDVSRLEAAGEIAQALSQQHPRALILFTRRGSVVGRYAGTTTDE